ncbi:ricin B lectin domain-containing protein [Mycena metata]|uniref:Ricin B lectin domain-containing protein n=1 Tax=Mycena metata TaxID=1033252 RepID=A0AAD7NQ04_9AGAR|nr:ricin B lectin domain-containing protein [Mycena metata]
MHLFWVSFLPFVFAASNQFIHPSVDPGKCLTGASNASGTPVTISDCITSGNSASQNWTVSSTGTLVLYGTQCLDVTNGAAASGTLLQTWTCTNNDANQQWTVGGASGSIVWTGHSFCLDLTKGVDADGTVMQIWACTPQTIDEDQMFTVTTGPGSGASTPPPTAETRFIHPSVDSGMCLTAASDANGTPVTISNCISSGPTSQSWTVSTSGTLVVYGNMCLDVTNGAAASGTLLQIWSCTSQDANQLWTVGTSGSISWTGMGFCLDLTKGVDADGTVMQIWACTAQSPDANQQFTLTTTPGSGNSVSIPITAGSATAVTGNLLSLSIEQDRWLDWSGNSTANTFFFNCLDNIVEITGLPPKIRIGADSEDHTNFNPNVAGVQDLFPPPTTTVPYPEATAIVAGPGFYQAAKNLPPGTGVTWGVNFGGANLTAVFLETQAIITAFASSAFTQAGIALENLELGNEADLYSGNGLRASSYNVQQYTPQWITFATNLTNTAKLSSSKTRLWGGAFAGSSHSTTGFSPQGIFTNGILSSAPGAFIETISQHHYSGSFCAGSESLLQDLMTKATIRSNLSSFTPDIQAVHAQGLNYVFGETNSYSCHGAPGVSNTCGAALWTLDYALFASQIGATQVYFHEGIGYKYNLIQPLTLTRSTLDGSTLATPQAPHIQPQYYAAIIIAEAIGDSGNTQVAELSISDARISGYAFYESGSLKRAVFINSLAYLKTTTTARPSTHVNLAFSGSGAPTSFTVKRLIINHADDVSNLTWGGQTYETSNGRVSGSLTTESGTVAGGIDIPATQAVMLSFN